MPYVYHKSKTEYEKQNEMNRKHATKELFRNTDFKNFVLHCTEYYFLTIFIYFFFLLNKIFMQNYKMKIFVNSKATGNLVNEGILVRQVH